jgi:ketosteroid isomerase-like protein
MKRHTAQLLIAGLLAVFAAAAQAKTLTSAALESWLQKYGAAWEARDAAIAGPLFTADASYQEMPFDAPMEGRAAIEEYWRRVTADQRDIRFESRVIAVSGNTGIAHWKATFRVESTGAILTLDGVFVLEFDASGTCKSLREWWHLKGG